jgi:hypothetical protein
MIITRKELEKVAKELSNHIDIYIYLNKDITNDNKAIEITKAIKDMIIKCDNAYYLIYYIDRFGKDGSIDIADDLLAKIDRNEVFFNGRRTGYCPYICIDKNSLLYLSTVYLSTFQAMMHCKQTQFHYNAIKDSRYDSADYKEIVSMLLLKKTGGIKID